MLRAIALLVGVSCALGSVHAETRDYNLSAGHNYLSIDLDMASADPSTVFADIASRVEFIAEYTGGGIGWRHFYPAASGHPSYLNTLDSLTAGRGYVVALTPGPDVVLSIDGTLPLSVSRPLESGWNFVGFLLQCDAAWWEPLGEDRLECRGMATAQDGDHVGFLLSDPPYGDVSGSGSPDGDDYDWLYATEFGSGALRKIEPGRAYWINSASSFQLGAQLALWIESDRDAGTPTCAPDYPDPLEDDEDLNGDGVLNYGYTVWDGAAYALDDCLREIKATQDTVHFRVRKGAFSPHAPALIQAMTVANRGDRGGTSVYSGNDTLRFETELDAELQQWLTVTPNSGVVRSPFSPLRLELRADIQGLSVGSYEGTLTVRSTGGIQTVQVKLEVPPIGGVYEGQVRVWLGNELEEDDARIRDRRTLKLSIDGGVCTILSERSPFLEDDVAMTFTPADTSFVTTGSITIDASDPKNVLGQTYTRTITLTGDRKSDDAENPGSLLPLQGLYTEVISGLGPDVTWTGRFVAHQVVEPN